MTDEMAGTVWPEMGGTMMSEISNMARRRQYPDLNRFFLSLLSSLSENYPLQGAGKGEMGKPPVLSPAKKARHGFAQKPSRPTYAPSNSRG
jgi:hypothetical protein